MPGIGVGLGVHLCGKLRELEQQRPWEVRSVLGSGVLWPEGS